MTLRVLLLAALASAAASSAWAGVDIPPPPPYSFGADPVAQQALSTLAGSIPQAATSAPNNPAPTPSAGSAPTFLRGDATVAALCRRTTVTTASDGSFSVSWATPLISANPWGHVEAVYAGATLPPVCWMRSISNAGLVGQCAPTQTTSLSLSIVTAGLAVSPFGAAAGAAGLTVKVSSCEPTQ